MTLMPAMRLEKRAPEFQNKGRIKVGADADITSSARRRLLTAPRSKSHYSTPTEFASYSSMESVLRDGDLVGGVFPGRLRGGGESSSAISPNASRMLSSQTVVHGGSSSNHAWLNAEC